MTATVVELDTGADDEVLDGARDEYLAWSGQRRDSRSDVHGEASDVVRQDLDLADVKPARISSPSSLTSSRMAMAQRTARAGPSNVARNPSPTTLTSFPPNRSSCRRTTRLWSASRRLPADVAELGGASRRSDDVGEQDRREHSPRIGRGSDTRDEVLDLRHDRFLVAGPDQVVGSGQLDVSGVGNVLGEVAAVLDAEAGRIASCG